MKKTLTTIISFIFLVPVFANAASFVVVPTSESYHAGDTVKVKLSVDPKDITVYTAMLDARFSADIFEVVSFSLNDNMLSLKQSGYDVIDNIDGILVKTGGYPGGVNTTTLFGDLVLRAKKDGVGVITVTDNSKILDSKNGDQQSGSQTISIAINPVRVTPPLPVKIASTSENTPRETTEKTVSQTEKTNGIFAKTQLASVADFVATNSVTLAVGTILVLIFAYRYFKRKREDKEE